jgi:hypothetical protein
MNADRFTFVVRRLTLGLSRRGSLGFLASLGLSALVDPDAVEARNK